jgi:hypothetical protein
MVRNAQYQEIPAHGRCEARSDAPTLFAPVFRRRRRRFSGEARLPSAEAAQAGDREAGISRFSGTPAEVPRTATEQHLGENGRDPGTPPPDYSDIPD